MKFCWNHILIIGLIINSICLPMADASEFPDSKIRYDIYFSGAEGTLNILRDVQILKITIVEGIKFLVVKDTGQSFKLMEAKDGYIRLDTVSAILPERGFRVDNADGTRVK